MIRSEIEKIIAQVRGDIPLPDPENSSIEAQLTKEGVDDLEALIQKSNQELLSRVERELPEKHEQKLSDPRSPNYNKDKGRFYRNGGRNFVIDQIKATIAKIRGEV